MTWHGRIVTVQSVGNIVQVRDIGEAEIIVDAFQTSSSERAVELIV